uniref:valine--tRNA ligase n=1 Tax=Panagrellus redivivus TaxID=6233 RepID=A0A7E4WE39_PANRE
MSFVAARLLLNSQFENGNFDQKELTVAKAGQTRDYAQSIPGDGTDALRFALMAYTSQSRDDVLRVQGLLQQKLASVSLLVSKRGQCKCNGYNWYLYQVSKCIFNRISKVQKSYLVLSE